MWVRAHMSSGDSSRGASGSVVRASGAASAAVLQPKQAHQVLRLSDKQNTCFFHEEAYGFVSDDQQVVGDELDVLVSATTIVSQPSRRPRRA